MRAKKIYETIAFKQGGNPYKKMGVGNVVVNRDPIKRLENFLRDNPYINLAYNGTSILMAPGGPHPVWQTIEIVIKNPDRSLEENKERIMNWFLENTDFEIIEWDDAVERKWHPWGDETNPELTEHLFNIRMRNEKDVQ